MDIGYDKQVGISTMIEYLRETNQMQNAPKIRGMTLTNFIKKNTLESATNYGFSPLDCLAENITWATLRRSFSVESILKFGMTFDVAIKIGLAPEHFGGDEGYDIIKKMNASEEELHDFLDDIVKLRKTGWSPAIAKEAGFSFEKIIEIGGHEKEFRNMNNWSIKNMVLEFQPDAKQWLQAGFTSACTEDGAWDATQYRTFISKETSKILPETIEENKILKVTKDYILKFDSNKILSRRFK